MRASPAAIAQLTDAIDHPTAQRPSDGEGAALAGCVAQFLKRQRRSQLLIGLLRSDRQAYVETASFLDIPRSELPNREGIPLRGIDSPPGPSRGDRVDRLVAEGLVPDCVLEKVPVRESPLDRYLLKVMRGLYVESAGVEPSPRVGILGLLDEVQAYTLSAEGAAPAAQVDAVVRGLRTLLTRWTPFLPAFFRVVMGGAVPSYDPEDGRPGADAKWFADGVQWVRARAPVGGPWLEPGSRLGPAFYAPSLMAVVAKYALSPLMGPSTLAFRPDGQPGGLVAERCIFLQESNCKGMCLNSCKLPAQQLFGELGLPVRVSPNFETQECNWAFGQEAPPVEDDPSWPEGCVVGCTSREAISELRRICG